MNIFFQVRYLVVVLFCIGATLPSYAQLSTSAALDTNIVYGKVSMRLQALATKGENIKDVDLSPLEDLEVLENIEASEWDTLESSQGLFLRKEITMFAYDSGYYHIPQLAIRYEENGQIKENFTPQLAFAVLPPQANATVELTPIKEIIEEPFRLEDLIPLLGTILIFGLLALIAIYFWRRRKQPEVMEEVIPEIIRPAHEIAFERLQSLKVKGLWEKGAVKEYHSELTYIVREYLENRYEAQALESTTDEILRDLSALGFDETWRDKLREMLQAADLVKFAKAEPPADFHERMFNYADAFVEATKKIEQATEEGETT